MKNSVHNYFTRTISRMSEFHSSRSYTDWDEPEQSPWFHILAHKQTNKYLEEYKNVT